MGTLTARETQLSSADQDLNSWLKRWHRWSAGYGYLPGYSELEEEGGLWSDRRGVMEMEVLDAIIEGIDHPHKTSLMIEARNLATGSKVWSSPRLPTNKSDLAAVVRGARERLMKKMYEKGLLVY